MDNRSLIVSFVMPAFNEEEHIEATIASIQQLSKHSLSFEYEIIVVDNGSNDATATLASKAGAQVLSKQDGTIASIRNYGASMAKGGVLVFLDADVCLSEKWYENITLVLDRLVGGEKIITGSHCAPPESENWFLKYWFQSFFEESDASHIGSAHMIMSKECFDEVGGFSEYLETGEDYDICQKAVASGYSIKNNQDLFVIHYDFPTTIKAFVQREAWHGVGDFQSLKNVFSSKVVYATTLFIVLHCFALISIASSVTSTMFFLLLIILLLLTSSLVKYSHAGSKAVIRNALIFYLYYFGRFFALLIGVKRLLKYSK
jgi:glycosyltransferase involved in cell wall biosynthesis